MDRFETVSVTETDEPAGGTNDTWEEEGGEQLAELMCEH